MLTVIFLLISFGGSGNNFENVTYYSAYDGDTITVNINDELPPIFGRKISVRIFGIDSPEMKGECREEKALAIKARNYVRHLLRTAKKIDLHNCKRDKYFRILADVIVDGENLGDLLLMKKYAVSYDGGTKTKSWCPSKD